MINRMPSGKWRVRVKHRGVVVADRVFTRKGDAVEWENAQRRSLMDGDFVAPAAGKTTIGELAVEYLAARRGRVSERGWESDESALRVHIVPAFGKHPVGSITGAAIEQFLTKLAVSRSRGTAARVRTTVRGLFGYAVQTRRIRRSPAAEVPLPKPDARRVDTGEVNPFTLPELLAVVEAQRAHSVRYAEITLVLGLTGLRMGELRGLIVKDLVEIPYPALLVRRSLPQSGRTGAIIERSTTKGGRSRLVPLSDLVLPVVCEWAAGKDGSDVLFASPQGSYLQSNNWRRFVRWNKTCQGRRPHDLRHTAATLWITAGVDIKTVSAWLGHSTARLTLDTYGHWMGTDADRAAMSRVNDRFRETCPPRAGDTAGTWPLRQESDQDPGRADAGL